MPSHIIPEGGQDQRSLYKLPLKWSSPSGTSSTTLPQRRSIERSPYSPLWKLIWWQNSLQRNRRGVMWELQGYQYFWPKGIGAASQIELQHTVPSPGNTQPRNAGIDQRTGVMLPFPRLIMVWLQALIMVTGVGLRCCTKCLLWAGSHNS